MFDKYQSSWSPFDRADGGCCHVAAALFDLEASVRFNDLQSCTSRQCMWKKKGKRNEGSLPIQELQTSSGGYGVTVKDSAKPRDFNPLCIPYDPAELEQQFKAGLLETFPSSSALPLELPKFNCKFKKNSVTYSLTKLWNSLPSHVRLSSDSSDVRSKLQDCSFLERVL